MSTVVEPPSLERYRAVRAQLATPLPARYNIAAAVCDRWAAEPGRTALLVPGDDGVRSVTFAELAEASSRLADGLESMGVVRGDRVGICLPQGLECATAHLALQRLAAIAVPLSTMAGSDALRHRILDADARIVITDLTAQAWLLDDDELGRSRTWIDTAETTATGARAFASLLAGGGRGLRAPVDTAIDDPALIIYTSGTSGQPKGVLHAQRVVPAHTEPISLAHDFFPQPNDILWSPADWAWAGGLVDCLFAALQAGRPIVAWRPRGFDPEAVLDMLARLNVTNAFLPPTALRLLRDALEPGRRIALRAVMTGGERCGEGLVTWCQQQLGLTPNEVYGQTEVSAVMGNSATVLPVRPGSVGLEYPRARAAVLDDDGRVLGSDAIGEIAFHRSTPAMFLGYWDGVGAAVPPAGEWHRTGDLGRWDADGYLWHEGRTDDVILSAGYRIGPGEIEEVIAQHPAVRAVAVVGEADELRGQVVSVVLELRDGAVADEAMQEELRQAVRSRLAPYEVPRRFHVVDALPRTDTGKVRRALLRQQIQEGTTA